MKKNVMMRIASFLLVAVLITTCGISGTYAKYVTADKSEDSARVAKWGVVITAESDKMFGSAYVSATGAISTSYNAATDSVNAYNGTDFIVAPGTNGNLGNFKIDGTPEVKTQVSFVGDVDLSGWTTDGTDFYCPLVFVIKDRTNAIKATIDGADYTEEAVLETAIATYINNFSAVYNANTNLSDEANGALQISWSWPYYISDSRDLKDTALGNAAAGINGGSAATIKIDVTCNVIQLD